MSTPVNIDIFNLTFSSLNYVEEKVVGPEGFEPSTVRVAGIAHKTFRTSNGHHNRCPAFMFDAPRSRTLLRAQPDMLEKYKLPRFKFFSPGSLTMNFKALTTNY